MSVHLNLDATLRDTGKRDVTLLAGARFELGPDVLVEAGPGVLGVGLPAENDLGAVDGPAGEALDHDSDFGVPRGPYCDRRQSPEKQRRYRERAQKSTAVPHRPIISPAGDTMGTESNSPVAAQCGGVTDSTGLNRGGEACRVPSSRKTIGKT